MEQEPGSPEKFEEKAPSSEVMKLFEQIREAEEKLGADNLRAFQDFVGVLAVFREQSERILLFSQQADKSLDFGFADLKNFFKARLDLWETFSVGMESSGIGNDLAREMSMVRTLPVGSDSTIFFEKLSEQADSFDSLMETIIRINREVVDRVSQLKSKAFRGNQIFKRGMPVLHELARLETSILEHEMFPSVPVSELAKIGNSGRELVTELKHILSGSEGATRSNQAASSGQIPIFVTDSKIRRGWKAAFDDVTRSELESQAKIAPANLAPFQWKCTNVLLDNVAEGNRRLLVEMPAGTGKTVLMSRLAWTLFESRWRLKINYEGNARPKILFMFTTKSALDQTYARRPNYTDANITRFGASESSYWSLGFADIHFATSAQASLIMDSLHKGFFDLIIIDDIDIFFDSVEKMEQRRDVQGKSLLSFLGHFESSVQVGFGARSSNLSSLIEYFGKPVYEYVQEKKDPDWKLGKDPNTGKDPTTMGQKVSVVLMDGQRRKVSEVISDGWDTDGKLADRTSLEYREFRTRVNKALLREYGERNSIEQLAPGVYSSRFYDQPHNAIQDAFNRGWIVDLRPFELHPVNAFIPDAISFLDADYIAKQFVEMFPAIARDITRVPEGTESDPLEVLTSKLRDVQGQVEAGRLNLPEYFQIRVSPVTSSGCTDAWWNNEIADDLKKNQWSLDLFDLPMQLWINVMSMNFLTDESFVQKFEVPMINLAGTVHDSQKMSFVWWAARMLENHFGLKVHYIGIDYPSVTSSYASMLLCDCVEMGCPGRGAYQDPELEEVLTEIQGQEEREFGNIKRGESINKLISDDQFSVLEKRIAVDEAVLPMLAVDLGLILKNGPVFVLDNEEKMRLLPESQLSGTLLSSMVDSHSSYKRVETSKNSSVYDSEIHKKLQENPDLKRELLSLVMYRAAELMLSRDDNDIVFSRVIEKPVTRGYRSRFNDYQPAFRGRTDL
jgi:hypothetical protein